MSKQWGTSDASTNAVSWAPRLVRKSANSANRAALFGNTSANAYFDGETIGLFGVSASEVAGAGQIKGVVVTAKGGSATARPTVTFADAAGNGHGATANAVGVAVSATVANGGTAGSYGVNDVLELSEGTAAQNATFTVSSVALRTAAVNAVGTDYLIGDVLSVAGTGTKATANVTHLQIVTADVVNGGTGYANGENVTIGGTGSNGSLVVTTNTSGGVSSLAVNASAKGDYTGTFTNAASVANVAVDGGSGTGLRANLHLGAKTVALLTGGSYTANLASLTAAATVNTAAGGTGATLAVTTKVGGVAVANQGSYTALPSNVAACATTLKTGSGAGNNAALAVSFGIGETVTITANGSQYVKPTVTFGGAGLTGAGGHAVKQEAAGYTHQGWVLRKVGQGGRAGRVENEVLVACHISSDATDDSVLPE